MKAQFKQHLGKLLLLLLLLNVQLIVSLSLGDAKHWQDIDWLDIAGEGGAVWLCLVWLALLLSVRPNGPVTELLFWGFTCFLLASGQDLLDEVVSFAPSQVWNDWVESLPMPIGMVLMTVGMLYWFREQQAINFQLRKRERGLRDHRCIDRVTGLADAQYLRKQLAQEIQQARPEHLPTALLMLDIDDFRQVNRRLGMAEGDRLLQELTEILLLNLRRRDLVCRYAGDRFAIVLPATCPTMAQLIADQLQSCCQHFAFRASHSDQALFHTVSIGLAVDEAGDQAAAARLAADQNKNYSSSDSDPVARLLKLANYRLAKAKEQREGVAA